MEQAAFEMPLSDQQLIELGRLVVNCGFVEFLLGLHASMLFQMSYAARRQLVSPLATRRKIELLKAGLHTIPKLDTRALVAEACKLVDPTIKERNVLLHGIWGFDGNESDGKPVVVSTKDTSGHRGPADITKQADALAIASLKLADAIASDGGGKPGDKGERLVIELAL